VLWIEGLEMGWIEG